MRDYKTQTLYVVFFGVVFCVSAVLITLRMVHVSKPQNVLRAVFPVGSLRSDGTLFDPTNTDSVWEYYLFENLAAGLIRDDVENPTGYQPLLAEKWRRVGSSEWEFQLREHLKWSDGSIILPSQIVDHFLRMKAGKSRHLSHLHFLNRVAFDSQTRTLKLTFTKPTDDGLLHELSLADAALVHPESSQWAITSGAYYISNFIPNEKKLVLSRNEFSTVGTDASPKQVELIGLSDSNKVKGLFKSVDVDLYQVPPFPFASVYRTAIESAVQSVRGVVSSVYFFYFEKDHKLSSSLEARQEFASFVRRAFRTIESKSLAPESQMIPAGYVGHLNHLNFADRPIRVLHDKKIVVDLLSPLEELSEVWQNVARMAQDDGFQIEFRFRKFFEPAPKEAFARFLIFQGNQSDPIGSWSFLFSENGGQLSPFRSEVIQNLNAAAAATSIQDKDRELNLIHQKVLDRAFAVPFLAAESRLLGSDRVDFSRLNPFDLRPRYYEIRWK